MKAAEAQALSAKLAAAFPRDWAFVGEATNAVYVEHIATLPRYQAALDAVNALIASEPRLPPISLVREEYRRHHSAYDPPALEEPVLSEEERKANLERLRDYSARIGKSDADGDAS